MEDDDIADKEDLLGYAGAKIDFACFCCGPLQKRPGQKNLKIRLRLTFLSGSELNYGLLHWT